MAPIVMVSVDLGICVELTCGERSKELGLCNLHENQVEESTLERMADNKMRTVESLFHKNKRMHL
jgi:hypothetical protein